MLKEENVVYGVGQLCPGGRTEAKWDLALNPGARHAALLGQHKISLNPGCISVALGCAAALLALMWSAG